MKALVLSGGGAKGAFTAGVLSQLGAFDVIIGCSSGALNAAGFSHLGPVGLEMMWRRINGRSDIFKFGWSREGVFSSDPLRKIVRAAIAKPASTTVWVNRVCLEDGAIYYTRSGDMGYEDAIIASCSLPGAVVPVRRDGKTWVDGGTRQNLPLKRAIDLGADDITIVLCSPMHEGGWTTAPGMVNYVARAFDLMGHQMLLDDIAHLERKNATKKPISARIYSPSCEMMGTLDFDPSKIRQAIMLGKSAVPRYINP